GAVAVQTLKFRPTGIKTGVNYLQAQSIEVFPAGDTYILRGQGIYFASPTRNSLIHQYFGQDIFMESLGPAVNVVEMAGISIGMNYTVPTTAVNSAMIRLYAHAHVFPSAIRIAGEGCTNLFFFQRAVAPMQNAKVGALRDLRLRVEFGDLGPLYLPLYDA
ncbi:unnamed protein product, partial [marine sediment metagenome]